jgi:uncharacterized protein
MAPLHPGGEAAMADEARNVEILKEAYKCWSDNKGTCADQWFEICDPNIAFGSLMQGATAEVCYMTDYSRRDQLRDYFDGLARDWEMIKFVVDKFVAQGDDVVAVGTCAWRYKKTGVVVNTKKCDIWQFANGKAVKYFEYYDTAQVAAAVGGGQPPPAATVPA